MPIYGKNLQKLYSYRTNSPMITKPGTWHYVPKLYIVYINDDPELTLTHFKTMSNLTKLVFVLIVGPVIRGAFTGPLVLWFNVKGINRDTHFINCRSTQLFHFQTHLYSFRELPTLPKNTNAWISQKNKTPKPVRKKYNRQTYLQTHIQTENETKQTLS